MAKLFSRVQVVCVDVMEEVCKNVFIYVCRPIHKSGRAGTQETLWFGVVGVKIPAQWHMLISPLSRDVGVFSEQNKSEEMLNELCKISSLSVRDRGQLR